MAGKPNVAIITYNMYEHEDKDGWPCHRQFDRSSEPRMMYAPRLSREMVLSVEAMYEMGSSIYMVCEQHMLDVREGLFNVDNEIT